VGFYVHTLYYTDEVADFGEVERPDVTLRPGELELAVRLVEDLGQPDFRLEQYTDDYRQRVLAAVESKRAGGTVDAPEPAAPPPTEDLIAALRQSLETPRPRSRSAEEAPASERTRRRAS
jgi:DNA end-binding protein Ku